jgi:pyrimidine-nucleoside phosphorylase
LRAFDIIQKKRDGKSLSSLEINFLIDGYRKGLIPDYQMSAWAMAVYFQGLSKEETIFLTQAMVDSGDTIDLSRIQGIKVDKHSTGGVADSTSLIIVPLLAAAGVPIVKMSGRGLGHTGGTIDKLEAIPGFKVELTIEEIYKQVESCGAFLGSQTGDLVPADKMLYSLRDVTATIDITSLIASSVMSKKIAAGADKIVLDVKVGSGAFMKNIEQACHLAETMVDIGKGAGKETVALITDMNQPLGNNIGNALEVMEAFAVLKGETDGRLLDLSLELAAEALVLAGKEKNVSKAKLRLHKLIKTKEAFLKMAQIIRCQGGNPEVLDDPSLLPIAQKRTTVSAKKNGFVTSVDAKQIGNAAMILGAGRLTKGQEIFQEVGIRLLKRPGDQVSKGDTIAIIHSRENYGLKDAQTMAESAIEISETYSKKAPLVIKRYS